MVASTKWFFLPSTAIRSGSEMPTTPEKELFVVIAYTENHELLPHRARS